MKVLFSQAEVSENQPLSTLESFGIENCYLKYLVFEKDYKNITLKTHHHTSFEIHIIKKGYQIYKTGDRLIRISAGQLLVIPPLMKHRVAETYPDTVKFSITFSIKENSLMEKSVTNANDYRMTDTPAEVDNNIEYIAGETKNKKEYFSPIIQNRLFECIIHILRLVGLKDVLKQHSGEKEDFRITIAKQYIKDNIEKYITVYDIAQYCGLSKKQITRIFSESEGIGVAEYIRRQKINYIEKLLSDSGLSLREISEKMNFNNEYYFNAFVKKNLGMSPGEYRKSV